jgi:hypothetical protein
MKSWLKSMTELQIEFLFLLVLLAVEMRLVQQLLRRAVLVGL